MALHLTVDTYIDQSHWHWTLSDEHGAYLADHTVAFDRAAPEAQAFLDPAGRLRYYRPITRPSQQLSDLGAWIGQVIFGLLQPKLLEYANAGGDGAIHLRAKKEAQPLLFYPFEIARLGGATQTFDGLGLRLIYSIAPPGAPAAGTGWQDNRPKLGPPKETRGDLRILAVFSLPVDVKPLNLRRERYQLEQFISRLVEQKKAVTLRVIQYGATPKTLERELQDGDKWDIVQLSGHGLQGELILESTDGKEARIDTDTLVRLLRYTKPRLKLLLLDACYTAAGQHAAARIAVGLDKPGTDEGEGERLKLVNGPTTGSTDPASAAASAAVQAQAPSLGQRLAEELDCAVVANRYPVGDTFATDLTLALYEKLLDCGQPLPTALCNALQVALAKPTRRLELSAATPVLMGPRAAELRMRVPDAERKLKNDDRGLRQYFERPPEDFVGRLAPMLRASQALAPDSRKRAVLFCGMPGGGKTTCALELAWRYDGLDRFKRFVWWPKKIDLGQLEQGSALGHLMQTLETQLEAHEQDLATYVGKPQEFIDRTLPYLKSLLEQNSVLLVLDNLEPLLQDNGKWKNDLWANLIGTLLSHNGLSRVILTSRVPLPGLSEHPAVQCENITALSFAESLLRAQELPNLSRLFPQGEEEEPPAERDADAPLEGTALLVKALRVAQGHPLVLDFVESIAKDSALLAKRVQEAEREQAGQGAKLDAFLRSGNTNFREDDFRRALESWTLAARNRLSPAARLLFDFLCALESEDRTREVVEANLNYFVNHLDEEHPAVAAIEGQQDLDELLAEIEQVGLIGIKRPPIHQLVQEIRDAETIYDIHPGVGQAAVQAADPAIPTAADEIMGDYWMSVFVQAYKTESRGGTSRILEAARRGVPYLMRRERWEYATIFLEQMLHRDGSPVTVDFALPRLRTIITATAGTDRELIDRGVLTNALVMARQFDEVEQMLRDLIAECVQQGKFRLASSTATSLVNLLLMTGDPRAALEVAEEIASYDVEAGLGPWTQVLNEAQRLQALNAMGQYGKVLETVEMLHRRMEDLPPEADENEAVILLNVREAVLDVNCRAAVGRMQWQTALDLNAKIVRLKKERGAPALEIARRRFNDYGPLLRLKRYDEARELLQYCVKIDQDADDFAGLSLDYAALADLEDATGNTRAAVGFQQIALPHLYRTGTAEDCASGHNNLAAYLWHLTAPSSLVISHFLAGAIIHLQVGSSGITNSFYNLALMDLPAEPPPFTDVVTTVKQVEGVRFHELFERLPRRFPNGDAAIQAVWEAARELKKQMAEGA